MQKAVGRRRKVMALTVDLLPVSDTNDVDRPIGRIEIINDSKITDAQRMTSLLATL